MKKLAIIVILIITSGLASILAYSAYTYLATQPQSESTFTLFKENGVVMYKQVYYKDYCVFKKCIEDRHQKLFADTYVTLDAPQITLLSGSFVKTESGKAQVVMSDNSVISIDENTELAIKSTASKVDILQIIGATWHRVQKVVAGGSYTVQTPTAIASVRGTQFGVKVSEEVSKEQDTDKEISSEIYVAEGQVALKRSEALAFDTESFVEEPKAEEDGDWWPFAPPAAAPLSAPAPADYQPSQNIPEYEYAEEVPEQEILVEAGEYSKVDEEEQQQIEAVSAPEEVKADEFFQGNIDERD